MKGVCRAPSLLWADTGLVYSGYTGLLRKRCIELLALTVLAREEDVGKRLGGELLRAQALGVADGQHRVHHLLQLVHRLQCARENRVLLELGGPVLAASHTGVNRLLL